MFSNGKLMSNDKTLSNSAMKSAAVSKRAPLVILITRFPLETIFMDRSYSKTRMARTAAIQLPPDSTIFGCSAWSPRRPGWCGGR
jgi:hypothetical protein